MRLGLGVMLLFGALFCYGCRDGACTMTVLKGYIQADEAEKVQAVVVQYPGSVKLQACCAANQSLLHFAAEAGNVPICRILVERGAHVDAEDCNGCTPLHLAANNGFLDAVAYLVECKANIDAEAPFPVYTPLLKAVHRGHCAVVKLLCSYGANIDNSLYADTARMFHSQRTGLTILRYLLQQGAPVNKADTFYRDPLASITIKQEREELGKALEEIRDVTQLPPDLNGLILLFISQHLRLPV